MTDFLKTRCLLLVLALSSLVAIAPRPAQAYQVDCAILLCLSGGWPASAPCAHARAVFIRRITPWPIEPPLQIWRCPMRTVLNTPQKLSPSEALLRYAFENVPAQSIPSDTLPTLISRGAGSQDRSAPNDVADQTAAMLLLAQSISDDNGTADIDISGAAFDFVRSIKVWRVDQYQHRAQGSEGDCQETDSTFLGTYGRQGDFNWARSSAHHVPGWMALSTSCNSGIGLYRAVGIEWHDYEGRHGYELVRY